MANEKRLISVCGECSNYDWKKHKCMVCSCEESDPRSPFYDDCPLPKGIEVVRCKDCKHYHPEEGWCDEHSHFLKHDGEFCHPWESSDWKMFPEDYYCADGERRCE